MPQDVTFDCPTCGAPIKTSGDVAAVHCDFCGNNLMVPENLRSNARDPRTPNIVIQTTTLKRTPSGQFVPQNAQTAAGRSSVSGKAIVVLAIVLLLAGIIVPAGLGAFETRATESSASDGATTASSSFAREVMSFGGRGRGPGFFEDAVDLGTDSAGDIYVVEAKNGRVQRFDQSGKYLSGWVVEDALPSAIAVNKATNEVYIVSEPKIFKYNGPTGDLLSVPLEKGSGFSATRDVALFPNGDLLTFVSGGSDDLVRLNPEGQEVSRFRGAMSAVYGEDEPEPAPWNVRLAVDGSERMLVFHKADSQVFIFEPDGRYSTRVTDENLFFPRDIAVDGKGRIYVSHGSGVKVFDYTGRVLGEIALENHDSVEAMEITSKGELLMVLGNEVVAKYVLQEP